MAAAGEMTLLEKDQSESLKPTQIDEPLQLHSLRLPDSCLLPPSIERLIYTNAGDAVLALASNATHKFWKWQRNNNKETAKATTNVPPQMWQPHREMANDVGWVGRKDTVPCFALSANDEHVISASGGDVSLFYMVHMFTFETMRRFMFPLPAATCLAFHPLDDNIYIIGTENSTIHIYDFRKNEVIKICYSHRKKVTGLAFSNVLEVLVSSGADGQLIVWNIDGWTRQCYKFLQFPSAVPLAKTRVQFHQDQIQFLVVHNTQLAIYEAPNLNRVEQWSLPGVRGSIADATYSCDSQSIYASFDDGSVCIFDAARLGLTCRINPTAYLPSSPRTRIYPLAIAAHPSEANQFAVGLNDGGVHILEPLGSEGRWGIAPPPEDEDGADSSGALTTGCS